MGQAATTLGAALILAAIICGIAQPQSATDTETDSPRECVRLININGYSTLDDRHLLLSGGASRHYLVTTRRACYGLQSAAQVNLSFLDTARICNARLEYLTIRHGGRCRIQTIEEVEDVQAARRLIEARAERSDSESR